MDNEHKRMDAEAEDIRDILIAISVVAKRLAEKLENGQIQEEQREEK